MGRRTRHAPEAQNEVDPRPLVSPATNTGQTPSDLSTRNRTQPKVVLDSVHLMLLSSGRIDTTPVRKSKNSRGLQRYPHDTHITEVKA
jgi:hypothetical protein